MMRLPMGSETLTHLLQVISQHPCYKVLLHATGWAPVLCSIGVSSGSGGISSGRSDSRPAASRPVFLGAKI